MIISPGVVIGPNITISDPAPILNYVPTNLVLYYDPSDAASYSGSGTTINDLSGNGLSGTMSDITYTDPYFSYNGASSKITVADNALLEPGTGDFTWEAWLYTSAPVTDGGVTKFFIGKSTTPNSYQFRIFLSAASYNRIQVGINLTSFGPTAPTALSVNTWQHVVCVWKNVSTNSLEIFVNGVSKVSTSHSISSVENNSGPLYIGTNDANPSGTSWWDGRIGIVRLYNTALSSSQVLQNYNGSKAIYGL